MRDETLAALERHQKIRAELVREIQRLEAESQELLKELGATKPQDIDRSRDIIDLIELKAHMLVELQSILEAGRD